MFCSLVVEVCTFLLDYTVPHPRRTSDLARISVKVKTGELCTKINEKLILVPVIPCS
jgi:hypothetical protein